MEYVEDIMTKTDYQKLYRRIFKIMENVTPLTVDCGVLCGGACCKGDSNTGMILFPNEESELNIKITSDGSRLAVCNGTCDRRKRPLACMIFPFFPTIDENGKIFVELDYRAKRACPMIDHCDEILFDPKFFKAVKKVGKLLAKDKLCREFLEKNTEDIDIYKSFLS